MKKGAKNRNAYVSIACDYRKSYVFKTKGRKLGRQTIFQLKRVEE